MRYTYPSGRDKAPYARWHARSQWLFGLLLSFGLIYPLTMMLLASLVGFGSVMGYLWAAFFLAIPLVLLQFEVGGRQVKNMAARARGSRTLRMEALVNEVCLQAGITWRPKVYVLPMKGMNAAATQSIFGGRKLIFFAPILELSDDELKAIIGHELAHIVHRDITSMGIVHVVYGAMRIVQFFAMVLFLLHLVYAVALAMPFLKVLFMLLAVWGLLRRSPIAAALFGYLALMTSLPQGMLFFNYIVPAEQASYLWWVWCITLLFTLAWMLVFAAYSRCREYLADAGGVAMVGWHNRVHLATALHHLASSLGGFEGIDEDAKKPDFLKVHPSVGKRLQALDIDDDDLLNAVRMARTSRNGPLSFMLERLRSTLGKHLSLA